MKVFHAFRLDTVNHCLWRGEERASLTPKAFDVLRYLVEHADRLVTQDEILEAVWPETYVNPEVVKKYILGIRKVLGDQPDKPVFVATFPRRGYQFIAPVQDERTASLAEITSNAMAKVVGRGSALAQLDSCLAESLQGHRQVIFVTGEVGIGKTTLVDLFHQRAAFRPDLHIARGQCVEGFGGKEAYYPVLEALGQLLRSPNDSPAAQLLIKRAPTWLVQFPSLVKVGQREALRKEILGATRERMVREICEVLEVLTAQNPLILILEDLHWVDPSTLDIVSALARRRGPAKLMLLGTYRPADVVVAQNPVKALKQDLLVHNLCLEVALDRLEESDVAQYMTREFPDAGFPAGLAALIYRQCGGNALFMRAILQELVRRGLIVRDLQRGWLLSVPVEGIAPGVPETLQQMVELQLAQLDAPEQRVLKSASVAGEQFSVWSISGTLDLDAEHIENLCEGLVERQRFISSAGIDELTKGNFSARYEFKHSLYREVIYRSLSDVNRSKLHRGVAERVKILCDSGKTELASELASHFEGARDYEQAIRYTILASENASRRFAYQDSIRILNQALDLASKVPALVHVEPEIRIFERIGDAHYALGDMTESARAFEAAAIRAADAGLRADEVNALCCLARTTVLIDGDLGIAACQKALKACEGADDPLLMARTRLLAATLRLAYDQWRNEDAETCAGARHTIARLSDPASPSYHEIWDTHRQSLQGEAQEAVRTAEAGIARYEIWATDRQAVHGEHQRAPGSAQAGLTEIIQSSSLAGYVLALSARSIASMQLGQFGPALEVILTARRRAEKNGSNPWLFVLREAWLHMLIFDFQGAQRLCDEITGTNAPYLSGQPIAMRAVAAGYAALLEQDYERATRAFGEVLDRDPMPKFFLHWYWRMQAELGMANTLLQKGDVAGARSAADRFLQSALSTADPNLQTLAWEAKARVSMAAMRWDESEECLQKALAILEKFVVPLSAWRVHETAWRLYGQRQDNEAAGRHRRRVEAEILALANSFAPDEPLRDLFLAALPVREVLEGVNF